jgi:RHS repeat-associated protein
VVDAAGRNYGVVDEINNYVFGNVLFAPNGAVMQANLSANSPAPFGGVQIYNFYNKRQQLAASYATWQPVLYGPSWSFISKHCYDYHVNGGGTFGDDNFTCTFSNTSPADNGNIYQITNGIDGNRTQNFSYDSLNRISQAYTSGPNWGETFTMDAWGNLTNKGPVAGKTNYENFNAPALVNNRLTGYSYDAAGNVLRDAMNNALTYDAENRIAQVGSNLSYTYDGDGQRVKKSSGTIYWSGTDGNALAESDLSGNINEEYIYFDGQRVARVDRPSGTVHYYVSDPLGSARIVADPTGVIGESDYYPYGGEIPITGSIGKYKFTGKERDSESGLDEFGARYYGSSLGRFMTPDWDMKPVTVPYAKFGDPQTLNLYSYVENEPINRIDPDGHTNPPGQEGINACAGSTTCVDAQKQDAAAQNQAAVAAVPTAMEEINAVVQPLVQSAEGALSKAGTTLLDVGADALLVGAYLVSPGSGGANNSNDTIQGHESSGSPEPQAAAGGAGARGRDPKRFFSAKDKQGLAAEAGNKCAICGGPTTPAQRSQRGVTPAGSEAQTDHKTPWSKGGATVRSNGQHVCRTCNINKGDD